MNSARREKKMEDSDLQSLTAQLALVTAALEFQTAALETERHLHAQTKQENQCLRSEFRRPDDLHQAANTNNKVLSLKQVVSLMYKEDASCVLIVRRIQRLGFRSVPVLREYFQSILGCQCVKKVIVVHSRSKGAADPSKGTVRPANMAFVLMERASDVDRALAQGPTVSISDPRNPGVVAENVSLHPFVKHASSSSECTTNDDVCGLMDEGSIAFDQVFLPSGIL
jgi:hypothetical protein